MVKPIRYGIVLKRKPVRIKQLILKDFKYGLKLNNNQPSMPTRH